MTQPGAADAPDRQHDDSLVPAAEFTVREFARTAAGSHRSTLDLEAYEREPLDDATLELVDFLARLGDLEVPALVLFGASDRVVTPAHGRAVAAAIPTAEFAVASIGSRTRTVRSARSDGALK